MPWSNTLTKQRGGGDSGFPQRFLLHQPGEVPSSRNQFPAGSHEPEREMLLCSVHYCNTHQPLPLSWLGMQLMGEGCSGLSEPLSGGRGPSSRPIISFLGCGGAQRATAPTQRLAVEHFGGWTRQERPFFLTLRAFRRGQVTPRPKRFPSAEFLGAKDSYFPFPAAPLWAALAKDPRAVCSFWASHK